jgi:acetolactate synthase regulatory subunit
VNGVRKIGGDKIRLRRPLRGVPKILAFAISRSHQNTACAGEAGKLNVRVAISDDERTMQVERVLSSRLLQHSGFRFAAIAAIPQSVRAIVYCVEARTRGFELLGHEFVDRVHQRFWKIAAAYAGLICNHNHRQTGFIQAANRIGHSRQDTKSADMIQVADFLGDGAVAIEKNGGTEGDGFRQGAPRS